MNAAKQTFGVMPSARAVAFILSLCSIALAAFPAGAIEPDDPGKGFDYVFWGYSPPFSNGDADNRAVILLDIDDPASPRPYPEGPTFKLQAASPAFGRVEVEQDHPAVHVLIGPQTGPSRFILDHTDAATNTRVRANSLLEPYDRHYLRSVIDVVHEFRRTRFVADCPDGQCAEPEL